MDTRECSFETCATRRQSLKHGLAVMLTLIAIATPGSMLSAGEAETRPTQPETLRVLSYNIFMWQMIGVDELAGMIRKADADIVGLNEAWNESLNDQVAKKLGYNIVYGGRAPKKKHPRVPHTVNGFYMPQVLLTKHKIVESRVFNAVATKGHERFDPDVPIHRGGTLAVLETEKGNRLVVFVLHLHPWGDGKDKKLTAMRLAEIKGILKKLEPYRDLPTLVIGDFNSRSHLDGKEGWKVTRELSSAGFTDVYRTVKPDLKAAAGLTYDDRRIDYIFGNKHVTPVDSKVVTAGVFGSKGYKQSDHLALFGTVKVANQRDSSAAGQ